MQRFIPKSASLMSSHRGLANAATKASSPTATSGGIQSGVVGTILPNLAMPSANTGTGLPLHAVPLSLATGNNKDVLRHKVRAAVQKFQLHETDCGSASAQVAVMTEKIANLARHFATHKKDTHSWRGFQSLISRRKQMLMYLKRSDFVKFRETVYALDLHKEVVNM